MRIAVLEAVSAGLCGDAPGLSLFREGLAMWRAVIEDLAAVPDVAINTLLGVRWQEYRPDVDRLHIWPTDGPAEAVMCWASALEGADHALVIAPESDDLILRLVEALPVDVRSWNCSPAAIDLCSDKLRLASALEHHGIATIPALADDWQTAPAAADFPCVIKPRDGAGSFLVRHIEDVSDWRRVRNEYLANGSPSAIRQPFIRGRAVSIAGWHADGNATWFPVAEQRLSTDGRFEYCGGRIPADVSPSIVAAVEDLVRRTAAAIPGLRGYVGFDVVCPDDSPEQPLLVEINPRFTTSYVGYRSWWSGSPWPTWLAGSASWTPQGEGPVVFGPDGT